MTIIRLGTFKRGDDKTFRRIVVSSGPTPQNLTLPGWSVACQLRPHVASHSFVVPAVAPGGLSVGHVVLSVSRVQTATMAPGVWVGDVQITDPTGRQSSDTFDVEVVADVTRPS